MKIYWQDINTKKLDAKDTDTQKIISALQNNEVLITTTDTIPGILANTTAQGFAALNNIKGDRQNKPYIVLISDSQKLDYFVDQTQITQEIKNLVKHCWPGPLTIIFKAKKELPTFLKSEHNTVAIRCPNYTPLLEILKHFNGLYSTSANSSYNQAPKTIADVDEQVANQVKYLIDDKDINTLNLQGSTTQVSAMQVSAMQISAMQASTIIDATQVSAIRKSQVKIIRQGAYSRHDLEKFLGKLLD